MKSQFEAAVDYSYAFSPPARALLFPELVGAERQQLSRLWSRNRRDLSLIRERANAPQESYVHKSVRLTIPPATYELTTFSIRYDAPVGTREIELATKWIDAILFPEGIGCVILRVEPIADLDLDSASQLSRHLKKIVFRNEVSVSVPALRDGSGNEFTWLEMISRLLTGLETPTEATARKQMTTAIGIHHVNWRVLTIAKSGPVSDPSPFSSELERSAFSLATGRGPNELQNLPTTKLARELMSKQALHSWQNWLALFHYGNLVAVIDVASSARANEFDLQLESFEGEFVCINALALSQLAFLQRVAAEVATISGEADLTIGRARSIKRSLLRWNTRVRFDEVCQSPLGEPLYELLSSAYGIDEIRTSVEANLNQIERYLESELLREDRKVADRVSILLAFLTFVGFPLTILMTLLSGNLTKVGAISALTGDMAWAILGAVLIISIVLFVYVIQSRRAGSKF